MMATEEGANIGPGTKRFPLSQYTHTHVCQANEQSKHTLGSRHVLWGRSSQPLPKCSINEEVRSWFGMQDKYIFFFNGGGGDYVAILLFASNLSVVG